MQIRAFEPSDETDYLAFSKDFYSGDATLSGPDIASFRHTFHEIVSGSPLVRGYLITADDTPAGYALITFTWNTELGGKTAILDELYLKPESRGKKLGSGFLAWLLQDLADVAAFRLEVCRQNVRAERLYASFGFEELPYVQMILKR